MSASSKRRLCGAARSPASICFRVTSLALVFRHRYHQPLTKLDSPGVRSLGHLERSLGRLQLGLELAVVHPGEDLVAPHCVALLGVDRDDSPAEPAVDAHCTDRFNHARHGDCPRDGAFLDDSDLNGNGPRSPGPPGEGAPASARAAARACGRRLRILRCAVTSATGHEQEESRGTDDHSTKHVAAGSTHEYPHR